MVEFLPLVLFLLALQALAALCRVVFGRQRTARAPPFRPPPVPALLLVNSHPLEALGTPHAAFRIDATVNAQPRLASRLVQLGFPLSALAARPRVPLAHPARHRRPIAHPARHRRPIAQPAQPHEFPHRHDLPTPLGFLLAALRTPRAAFGRVRAPDAQAGRPLALLALPHSLAAVNSFTVLTACSRMLLNTRTGSLYF